MVPTRKLDSKFHNAKVPTVAIFKMLNITVLLHVMLTLNICAYYRRSHHINMSKAKVLTSYFFTSLHPDRPIDWKLLTPKDNIRSFYQRIADAASIVIIRELFHFKEKKLTGREQLHNITLIVIKYSNSQIKHECQH